MRATLSALGVIIAVAAVIAHDRDWARFEGHAAKEHRQHGGQYDHDFPPVPPATAASTRAHGSAVTLTPKDVQEIARQCPAVKSIAPLVRARSQIVYGNKNCVPENIYGTTPSYLETRDWKKMAAGEMFSDRDVRNSNKVCVIGTTIKQNLFPKMSPLGKEIPHQQRRLPASSAS